MASILERVISESTDPNGVTSLAELPSSVRERIERAERAALVLAGGGHGDTIDLATIAMPLVANASRKFEYRRSRPERLRPLADDLERLAIAYAHHIFERIATLGMTRDFQRAAVVDALKLAIPAWVRERGWIPPYLALCVACGQKRENLPLPNTLSKARARLT